MTNFKPGKFARRRDGIDGRLVDTAIHPLGEVGQVLLKLPRGSFDDKLHPAVGKVLDVTSDGVALGQPLGFVAKADALHLAAVMDLPPLAGR